MIIDSHVHIFSYPSFKDLSKHIRTMEDAIAFRTRYPDLYNCNLTEQPIDSTDDLVGDMDKNGVDFALVQARAGYVSNDVVAEAAKRHPEANGRAGACRARPRGRRVSRRSRPGARGSARRSWSARSPRLA